MCAYHPSLVPMPAGGYPSCPQILDCQLAFEDTQRLLKIAIDLQIESYNLTNMRDMSVTEVARNFSAVMAEVEAGEEIRLFKGKREVGRLVPPKDRVPNGAAFIAALLKAQADGLFGNEEFAKALEEIVEWRYHPMNYQTDPFEETYE